MPLTTLQNERIAFHLDYVRASYLLSLDREISIGSLNESQVLGTVGPDLATLDPASIFVFEGQNLCSTTSLLGKVERAFANLDPSVIEDSLFVSQAGSVSLRGSELQKREALYLRLVKYLAQIVGASSKNRVGW